MIIISSQSDTQEHVILINHISVTIKGIPVTSLYTTSVKVTVGVKLVFLSEL